MILFQAFDIAVKKIEKKKRGERGGKEEEEEDAKRRRMDLIRNSC